MDPICWLTSPIGNKIGGPRALSDLTTPSFLNKVNTIKCIKVSKKIVINLHEDSIQKQILTKRFEQDPGFLVITAEEMKLQPNFRQKALDSLDHR